MASPRPPRDLPPPDTTAPPTTNTIANNTAATTTAAAITTTTTTVTATATAAATATTTTAVVTAVTDTHIKIKHIPATQNDITQDKDECYVRNSSFLSRDIEAQKAKIDNQPLKCSPPKNVAAPPRKSSLIKENSKDEPISNSPPVNTPSPPDVKVPSPPKKDVIKKLNHFPSFRNEVKKNKNDVKQNTINEVTSPPVKKVTSPPLKKVLSPPPKGESPPKTTKDIVSPPPNKVTSPTVNIFKFNTTCSKQEDNALANKKKETTMAKEAPIKSEKLSLTTTNEISEKIIETDSNNSNKPEDAENVDKSAKAGESNGVGDKIRKFEKAAEDASGNVGRLSRPGSVRRTRTERIGSDSKEDLPPPATPFKDHVFFDIGSTDKNTEPQVPNNTDTQNRHIVTKGLVNSAATKWQRNEEEKIQKPEPQRIIKPEFKPMPSPIAVTIRSPSLGTKLPDQFPSHGTAFRNVASPDTTRPKADDVNTPNSFKCKPKNKEKYSVSKGSSYFTRGSEEIWLVKKKDIEEIEERVLDSFRRAGGNVCMRSESMRPSSDSGQGAAFTHATMGRTKRQMYARSESLDPQWAGARAQTLKRQSSVACTCGHDKKTRAKSVDTNPRPRSRSHGDDNNQAHVLDKYETLV